MGGNVSKIIEGTFAVLFLMWILTHATEFGTVTSSITDAYVKGVGVLEPSNR